MSDLEQFRNVQYRNNRGYILADRTDRCVDDLVPARVYDALLAYAEQAEVERLRKLVPQWISVEERLPDEGVDILFNVPGCYGVEKGRRLGEIWVSDRTDSFSDQIDWTTNQITHWMPLPEPPKDGE